MQGPFASGENYKPCTKEIGLAEKAKQERTMVAIVEIENSDDELVNVAVIGMSSRHIGTGTDSDSSPAAPHSIFPFTH